MTLALNAPARPRSAVSASTATPPTSRRSSSAWPCARELAAATSTVSCCIRSAYGRSPWTRACARRSREAATSSMAFVILPVLRTDRMRRAMSCWVAIGWVYAAEPAASCSPSTKKLSLNEPRCVRSFSTSSSGRSPVSAICFRIEPSARSDWTQLVVEPRHVGHRDRVDEAVRDRPDHGDLLLDRPRRVLALVERRHHALAAGELPLGGLVELGAELGERLELAVGGEVEAQAARHLLHRPDLGVAADARHRDAGVDGRPHARVEEVGLQEDLAVGDRDHVRRDVGRHVAGLRLDDGQGRERAAAEVVGQLHRPLEQPRVQVEDVARVGLAARRAAHQERHLPVGVGVLGEVVVDARARACRCRGSARPWRSRRTGP